MTTFYKIRRISDGLYSTGGTNPGFTARGKTWSQLGHVKSHVTRLLGYVHAPWFTWPYDDCEIVEGEMRDVSTTPILDFADECQSRRHRRLVNAHRRSPSHWSERDLERSEEAGLIIRRMMGLSGDEDTEGMRIRRGGVEPHALGTSTL